MVTAIRRPHEATLPIRVPAVRLPRKAPGRAAAEHHRNSAGIFRVMHQSAFLGPGCSAASAAMRDRARIFSISVELTQRFVSVREFVTRSLIYLFQGIVNNS